MGKYVLLSVLAGALGTGLLMFGSQQTSLNTVDDQAEREAVVIARQIARSAFNTGLSQLKQDFNSYRVDRTGVPYEHGTFDLSASGPAGGPVALTATGTYEGAVYRIRADVLLDVNGIPGLGIQGSLGAAKAKGNKFLVSGRDTDPVEQNDTPVHGSGSGADRHGMRLDDRGSVDLVKGEYSGDQVVGVNGEGDVVHESIGIDLDVLQQEIENNTTHTEDDLDGTVGSPDHPAIVAVNGDLDLAGNVHGTGALFVDGNFRMRGDAQWDGIVLVANGDARVDTEGDINGNARVFGSFLQKTSGSGRLEIGGSVRMQYSSKALKVLDGILPPVSESIQLRVTNRTKETLSTE